MPPSSAYPHFYLALAGRAPPPRASSFASSSTSSSAYSSSEATTVRSDTVCRLISGPLKVWVSSLSSPESVQMEPTTTSSTLSAQTMAREQSRIAVEVPGGHGTVAALCTAWVGPADGNAHREGRARSVDSFGTRPRLRRVGGRPDSPNRPAPAG